MNAVRPPALAGYFYPADPARLRSELGQMLAAVPESPQAPAPKALLVPHAGYVYSGPVAASGYARLAPAAGKIRRVVLLGPAHRVALRGLALPAAEKFASPLGEVALDLQTLADIAGLPQVMTSEAAHAQEHSLEVHLPFLQTLLGEFQLLPLVVGRAAPEEVAQVLERVWGGPETLIVVSSDLSHYLPYDTARETDAAAVERMLRLEPGLDHAQACGATPVNGLLALARRRGLCAELLDLRNSGDTAGDKARVVGYAALAFYESPLPQPDERGAVLLAAARGAISERFGAAPLALHSQSWLRAPGASFVTLTLDGELRGCIGSLEAHRPLLEDVQHNAVAAAFRDPRFAPLSNQEFARVRVEVSELSAAEPLACESEAHALSLLRPHVDGLILQYGHRRGTFLPQVWETLPAPQQFLAQLKRKAGLPADFWHEELRLSRYEVKKWRERAHD